MSNIPSRITKLTSAGILALGLLAGGQGAAGAAGGCDLGELGREGIAPDGTQVSVGGKVFVCKRGSWSML